MNMSTITNASEGSQLITLEEIGRLVSQKGEPAETLANIVGLIQKQFDVDVCSVYLIQPDRANLVLAATVGLRPKRCRCWSAPPPSSPPSSARRARSSSSLPRPTSASGPWPGTSGGAGTRKR